MDKKRATSAKPKTRSIKSAPETYELKCYCSTLNCLGSSSPEILLDKTNGRNHSKEHKFKPDMNKRVKSSVNEFTYLCYEPKTNLINKKPSCIDNKSLSNYNNILQPNKFTDLLLPENKITANNNYYLTKLNPTLDKNSYINKFKTHKDCSSDEEYIKQIREFRKQNFEDCHSTSSFTKVKAQNRNVTEVMNQMIINKHGNQPQHNCKHHFVLNSRLFPIPINSNEHGVSICAECQLPLRNSNKIPLQTSDVYHSEQNTLQNTVKNYSKGSFKNIKVHNKPVSVHSSSKSASNAASSTSCPERPRRCNLVGHKYVIPRHITKIAQPNSLALRFQE